MELLYYYSVSILLLGILHLVSAAHAQSGV